MIKRLFWVGVGVATTVIVLRKVQQVNESVSGIAKAVSPTGIAESVGSLAQGLKETALALRQSMAENEAALSAQLLPDEQTRQRARATRHRANDTDSGRDDDPEAYL